jgi:DNA replication protein DnaC
MEAIRHGFSVYFVSLPDLLDRLVQAQAEKRMRRKMAHLRKCRLLILDEIGYRSLDRQATTCLFQSIGECYERALDDSDV